MEGRIALWASVIYIAILMFAFAKNRLPRIVSRLGAIRPTLEEDEQALNFAVLFAIGYPLYIYALLHTY